MIHTNIRQHTYTNTLSDTSLANMAAVRELTWDEISRHNSQESCWVVVSDDVSETQCDAEQNVHIGALLTLV